MDGQGWHCSDTKGRPGEKLERGSRLLEKCGKPSGLEWRILEVSQQLFFVVCAHRIWWGWSIQGQHNWLQILSFTLTQGLLAEIPRSLEKLIFLAFICFSVMSEHTDRRLCGARRATCWELRVLPGWCEVSRVGFSAHLPFPIAAPCCSIWHCGLVLNMGTTWQTKPLRPTIVFLRRHHKYVERVTEGAVLWHRHNWNIEDLLENLLGL